MRALVALALVAALVHAARADDVVAAKSPDVAYQLSVGGEAGSIALVVSGALLSCGNCSTKNDLGAGMLATGVVGAVLAPSFGHWYAGEVGWQGLALRLGGGAVGMLGVGVAFATGYSEGLTQAETDRNTAIAIALFAVGVGAFIAGTAYDFATVKRAATRYNTKHRVPAITPTVLTPPSGPVMGLGLTGRF